MVDAMRFRGRFGFADVAQQLVGGFLLAGPFVVTQEVWDLARAMSPLQTALTAAVVFLIGYGALYEAVEDRDPEDESEIAGFLPTRFLSLILVSYGSVTVLALLLAAPEAFDASLATTAKAVNVGAIFSVVGASTADSVF